MVAIGAMVAATVILAVFLRLMFGPSSGGRRSPRKAGDRSGQAAKAKLGAVPDTMANGAGPASQPGLGKLPTIRPAAKQGRAARRRGPGELPPEALITFADERKVAAIDDIFAALDRELVGLVPVKKQVEEIGSLLLVDRVRQRFGLVAPRPNLHMCFTGAPGTGKTTVGLLMADLLHQLGYLEQGQLVHAMRDDLVGEYIGQTAPKTRRLLDRAMGGVLFIDEASALYQPDNGKDFGLEAIEILLQVMENERDKFVVILAGYLRAIRHRPPVPSESSAGPTS